MLSAMMILFLSHYNLVSCKKYLVELEDSHEVGELHEKRNITGEEIDYYYSSGCVGTETSFQKGIYCLDRLQDYKSKDHIIIIILRSDSNCLWQRTDYYTRDQCQGAVSKLCKLW